jgi:hypothetical protein
MANPRNTVDFEGIAGQEDYATFIIDNSAITYDADEEGGSAQVGLAVTLSADKTISTVADGECVLGKLIKVEKDLKATVQVRGFMTLPGGTGASLTRGKAIVGDLLSAAEGYVREVATATAAELGVMRGTILDDDATNPWILL